MIVDLFAGPGGWSEGLRALGLADVGVEWDAAACATRHAAGHATVRADVESYPAEPFAGKTWGLIASPPCPDFSAAGSRAGIAGPSGRLIRQVPRWVEALRPEWVACEQVPGALPYWKLYAHQFAGLGYSTWAGVLCAADYGVPQTRDRAFLLASRVRVAPPEPTHAKTPGDSLFGRLEPWVSMADALGWGLNRRPANTLTTRANGGGAIGSVLDGGSGARRMLARERAAGAWVVDRRTNSKAAGGGMEPRPAPTLTGKSGGQWVFRNGAQANATVRTLDEPAPTVLASADNGDSKWFYQRPATTLQGDPRVWPPGHKVNASDRERLGEDEANERYGDRAGTEAIKLTTTEALILQSFRPDYPLQGTRTKQFEQVGNAVPPLLAAHVLSAVTGRTLEAA